MKDIVKKVIDGEAMTPVETPYPPSMIKTAIYMTVANLIGQAPVRGHVKLDAPLITPGQRQGILLPGFFLLTIGKSNLRQPRRDRALAFQNRKDKSCQPRRF